MNNPSNINEKPEDLKKYLLKSNFESISQIIDSLKSSFHKIEWKFFHPFFNMLIEKFSYIIFKDLYFDKSNNIMICIFHIKKEKLTQVDLISILYCSIDEIFGKFIYLLDEKIFVTTEISIEKNENQLNSIEILNHEENSEDQYNFLCLVNLKETSNSQTNTVSNTVSNPSSNVIKKITFNFNLYFIKKNSSSDASEKDKSKYSLKEYLSGSSVFKRLNKNIPMSKF
jgi:hypothetical protein